MNNDHVSCKNCGASFHKEDLQRSCGNCFACFSCEIYVCPVCEHEIVVRPMKKKGDLQEGSGNST